MVETVEQARHQLALAQDQEATLSASLAEAGLGPEQLRQRQSWLKSARALVTLSQRALAHATAQAGLP